MSKDTKRFLIRFIAILVVVIAALYLVLSVYKQTFNPVKWFPAKQDTQNVQPENKDGGATISPGESHGVALAFAKINIEDYPKYNLLAAAVETSYTVTATITPQGAENQKVDYAVAWDNPSSEWATGKTVTEYVTVTQSTDGALQAVVTCKQAFGEKIVLTCTSRDTLSKASATADVHYVQRNTGFTVKLEGGSNNIVLRPGIVYPNNAFKPDMNADISLHVMCGIVRSGVYTKKNTDMPTKLVFAPTEEFASKLVAGLSNAVNIRNKLVNTPPTFDLVTGSSGGPELTKTGFLDKTFFSTMYQHANERNLLIRNLVEFAQGHKAAFKVEAYIGEDKIDGTIDLTLDTSIISGQYSVTSVGLDKSELDF